MCRERRRPTCRRARTETELPRGSTWPPTAAHGLHHEDEADLIRKRRARRDVPYDPPTRAIKCVSCPPTGAPATSNVEGEPERALHDRRRPRVLLHPRTRWSTARERDQGRLRVRRRPAAADQHRHRRGRRRSFQRDRPGRRQRATAPTRSSRPTRPSSGGRERSVPEVLRRPHRAAVSRVVKHAGALRGGRRVPRRGKRPAGPAGDRHRRAARRLRQRPARSRSGSAASRSEEGSP